LGEAIGRRLNQHGLDRPRSTIIVEDIEHLNNALRRGSYFFTAIRKEGVLLFDSGRHTLAEAGLVDPLKVQQHTHEDFEHWFTSASRFYGYFDYAFQQEEHNEAAFLLHQATERFLNAVVLTFVHCKPRTHDIEKLDRQASNLHPDFFTVFPRANERQQRCFDLLKKAYIDTRYKRDYAITREELDYLAARVRKLQELTKRICEEKIADLAVPQESH
jgi:uncharacterized protein